MARGLCCILERSLPFLPWMSEKNDKNVYIEDLFVCDNIGERDNDVNGTLKTKLCWWLQISRKLRMGPQTARDLIEHEWFRVRFLEIAAETRRHRQIHDYRDS